MKKTRISDFWLYKFRYQIAYGTLFLAYLAIIFHTIFIAPNGLTSAEIESAKSSANINFTNIFSGEIINLPFRLLQNLSISIFGLSNFSIKLPAILISIATVFAVIKLSHTWFSKGTATLAAILAIASGQFFFIAQNGTAEILYIFYPILLIWLGAKFLETKKKRTLLPLATVLALSFYTPLSIYIVLAFGLTILAHPHLRFALNREIEKKKRIIAVATFGVILLPLAIAVVRDFSIIKTIFGVPNSLNIFENIGVLISNLFSFSSKNSGGVISPIISPPVLILIAIGLYFTFNAKHTAKSYLVNIWLIILLLVCVINPNLTAILFTPILILTITGLQSLIQTWYTIFPQNPYARVLGLIPISFFVISLLLTSLNNFRQNYVYSPEIVLNFNQDLKLLAENSDKNRVLMVSENEKTFYEILEKQKTAKIVSDFSDQEIIVSRAAFEKIEIPKNYKIKKIVVSERKDNTDRFYILTKS